MATYYNGNLSALRKKVMKIISKRAELRKEFNYNLSLKEQDFINKKISNLTSELDKIQTEIKKVQKGMINSNKWMNGNFEL